MSPGDNAPKHTHQEKDVAESLDLLGTWNLVIITHCGPAAQDAGIFPRVRKGITVDTRSCPLPVRSQENLGCLRICSFIPSFATTIVYRTPFWLLLGFARTVAPFLMFASAEIN